MDSSSIYRRSSDQMPPEERFDIILFQKFSQKCNNNPSLTPQASRKVPYLSKDAAKELSKRLYYRDWQQMHHYRAIILETWLT